MFFRGGKRAIKNLSGKINILLCKHGPVLGFENWQCHSRANYYCFSSERQKEGEQELPAAAAGRR